MSISDTLKAVVQETKSQGRRWMLTINNPTFEESEKLWQLAHTDYINCMVYGAEHADEENKTEHFQIYIAFKQMWRFNRIKTIFPRAYIALARKTTLACCKYCAKEGFYFAFGNVPPLNGPERGEIAQRRKAEDLAREQVIKKIRAGELRFQDLSDEQLLDTKLVRAAKDASSLTQGPFRPELYVCVFVSPTGWGKSYSIWETFKRLAAVEFGATQEWFLDAEQEVMIFDEFCGQIRATKMLKYLDIYPISLPIKGGHRPCYWKLIFICSNTSPDEWYMKEDPKTGIKVSSIPDEVRQALYRRIGYPANSRGETHVYDPLMCRMVDAQKEMKQICLRLYEKLYPSPKDDPNIFVDPDKQKEVLQQEREDLYDEIVHIPSSLVDVRCVDEDSQYREEMFQKQLSHSQSDV